MYLSGWKTFYVKVLRCLTEGKRNQKIENNFLIYLDLHTGFGYTIKLRIHYLMKIFMMTGFACHLATGKETDHVDTN
jgi:hypothetical protein